MTRHHASPEQGFILIVTMIILMIVALLAVGGMRSSMLAERMAGAHLDRSRAKSAAEQAITQGLAVLQQNANTCLDPGCSKSNVPSTSTSIAGNTLPSAWTDLNAIDATLAGSQKTSGKYVINWLTDPSFTTGEKLNCRAYSVMGKGVGLNTQSIVILQTVAYVCPTE